jgi:hypothetical protein
LAPGVPGTPGAQRTLGTPGALVDLGTPGTLRYIRYTRGFCEFYGLLRSRDPRRSGGSRSSRDPLNSRSCRGFRGSGTTGAPCASQTTGCPRQLLSNVKLPTIIPVSCNLVRQVLPITFHFFQVTKWFLYFLFT